MKKTFGASNLLFMQQKATSVFLLLFSDVPSARDRRFE